jgi:hypothetical protein
LKGLGPREAVAENGLGPASAQLFLRQNCRMIMFALRRQIVVVNIPDIAADLGSGN